MASTTTKAERAELLSLVRKRERVMIQSLLETRRTERRMALRYDDYN
jgi:hypothetical protein